jgi:membrane fusion protein, multidrug efflux system
MNTPQNSPTANAPSEKTGNPAPPPPPGQPARKEHHWGTWILVLLVIVLGIGAFLLFSGKKPKPPMPAPISITVTNVLKGDIAVAVSSLGSVQPVYTATISPRVDGQVITVNYTEGQMVASNDLLAVIDPGPYQAALTEATGQLERDKALLEGANVDLKRYQAAYLKNAIPKQQYDDQLALVHQDEGTVKFDEGQVENARVQLAYAYIRAPFAGRVGLRLVDPGNVVHAANTNALVVVAQLQPITVVFNVAEDYLPQIQEQMQAGQESAEPSMEDDSTPQLQPPARSPHPMTVEAWDRGNENKIALGRVLALNNLIDTATGTVRLKAIFDNTNLTLFPNQFVNAKLIIKTLHGLSLIPTYAIQQSPDGAFVYVVTNTTVTTNGTTTNYESVTMRNVVAGTVDGNTTSIIQGLQPGEVIALDNFNKLGEGVKVAPRQPDEGAKASGAGKHKGGGQGKKPDEAKESP